MYSAARVDISSVKLLRALTVLVWFSFFGFFFTFFFAPIQTCAVVFAIHVGVFGGWSTLLYGILSSLVLSQVGEGVPAAAPKLGAGAGAPGSMESEAKSDSNP